MAIGTKSDFKIYHEEFYGGVWEGLAQVTEGFNGGSLNALRLVTADKKGDYEKESFFTDVSGLIAHRNPTTTSAATAKKLTQAEHVAVKVPRLIGPVDQTLDSWRRIAKDEKEMSFLLGRMIAGHKAADYINTMILCATTALKGQAAVIYDATGQSTKTTTHGHLVSAMAKMGDMASRIRCFVSHSKPYFDLMQQSITDKIFEVAGVTIWQGTVASFGKPWITIDAPALHDANGSATDTYSVLGLVEGAATLTESEEDELVAEIVTGLVNLVFRVQGEYAFNVEVKGLAWDITNGGADPDDTALGTTTNWDKVVTDMKNGPGVLLKVE